MNHIRHAIVKFIKRYYCEDLSQHYNYETSEPDEYSHTSIYAAAYIDNEIVGSIRLILGDENHITSLFPFLNVTEPEISRVVVRPDLRGDHRIMIRLIREASLLALEYQQDEVCCMIHEPLYNLIVQMGYPFRKLMPATVDFYGQPQYVVTFKPDEAMDLMALHTRNTDHICVKRAYPEKRKVAIETTAWL